MPHARTLFLFVFALMGIFTFSLQAQNQLSAEQIKQDTLLARQLQDSSNVSARAGQQEEQMRLLDSVGVLYARALGKNSKYYAGALLLQGQAFNAQGQVDSAMARVKAAQEILPRISGEKRDIEALVDYTLGDCFRIQQKYDQAITYQEKALALRIDFYGENNFRVAYTYNNLSVLHQIIKNYDKALEYSEKALSISQKIYGQESYEVALAYTNIGFIYAEVEEYEQALADLRKGLDIMMKLYGENDPTVAEIYFKIGVILSSKGNYEDALAAFQKTYQIKVNQFGEKDPALLQTLDAIGTMYLSKSNKVRALEYYEKGMDIIEHYDEENPDLPYFYMNIGTIYADKRDYDRSFTYYTKALETARRIAGEESLIVAECYTNIGAAYQDWDENTLALSYYEKALNLYLKIGEENNPAVAITYSKIGIIHNLLGDPDQAIAYYEKANALFSKNYGEDQQEIAHNYNLIGASYAKKKMYDQALAYYNKALEIQLKQLDDSDPEVVNCYNYLGDFYQETGNYEQAIASYEKALTANGYQTKHLNTVLDLDYLINSFAALGNTYITWYQKKATTPLLYDARQYFIQSAEAIDTLRNAFTEGGSKQTLLQNNYAVYEGLLKTDYLLFHQTDSLHYLQEAFQYSSRAKSQLLNEALQEADALRFAGLPDSLLQQEYDLRIDITYNEKQKQELLNATGSETDSTVLAVSAHLFDLKEDYENLKKRFITNYPDYYKLKYNQSVISAKEVQQELLHPGQAMIEYFVGDSSIFVFVLRPDTLVMQEVKKDFPLEDWVKSLRDNIYLNRTTGATAYAEAAYNLYQKLILPVKSLLPEQLIIIPDGILGYVPFEALLTAKPERAIRFNTHPYLLKEYQISYCYSATLLREMQQKKQVKEPTGTLLAVAPFYTGDTTLLAGLFAYDETTRKDLAPLQNSGEEVYRINKLWKGDVLTGEAATEAAFTARAGNYRILHLATHGRADERVGDYSFLAFSEIKDSVENELLYVRDLYNLQLNADLVVLSACETGLGKLSRGEGIISLARAFAYAGAKSIITTLWSVDDAKTKDLMVDFYRKLKKGMTKDAALRQAKLDYLESHTNPGDAHPFYWAGFAPIGDMRVVK